MEDNSTFAGGGRWVLGAVGLGSLGSAFLLPYPYSLIIALSIVVLFVLFFGGYMLWQRRKARREREQFTSAVEAQTAAAPKVISDPTQRANLDRVRQKFQTGLQEFKSRGKDLYKLPWYVIIGESGSGKSEAIRHSSIDFPPGMQDELQGSGGTVNMDWWFTNESIILDTAGSMVFNDAKPGETPEWKEFLRLLKRTRPDCPINGLFLVLSVDSLIRDAADTISSKASRLAQQLDLIQRTLDVRFPVYLLVTKCDLLTGFREFFDVNDPDFQYQMFGWSNPDPLDSGFRPELVEQHLRDLATRLRRRRLALIRETSAAGRLGGDTQQFFSATYQLGKGPSSPTRRLDEVDSMFAFPESVLRLAPRLRRYLETIFIAGEWSAKPVFLRGIYFTSSMREGQALDEAIAQATGLSLDQLPGERSLWEKNRAFFLRDLFKDKVFREAGLVTRATNTLKLLRQRQVAIFGTAGGALLLLLILAGLGYSSLKRSVLSELSYWQAGAGNIQLGWKAPIVAAPPNEPFHFALSTNYVEGVDKLTLPQYLQQLKRVSEKPLAISLVFRPMAWINAGSVRERPHAEEIILEASVLKPIVDATRKKLASVDPAPGDLAALQRHGEAVVSLVQLQSDTISGPNNTFTINSGAAATRYLKTFMSYLMETNWVPDTNLVDVFSWTYDSKKNSKAADWPPTVLLRADNLARNPEITSGLDRYQTASAYARTNIDRQLKALNELADNLRIYRDRELAWVSNSAGTCSDLTQSKAAVDASWRKWEAASRPANESLATFAAGYETLKGKAAEASASALRPPIALIQAKLPESKQKLTTGLLPETLDKLKSFGSQAAANVSTEHDSRRNWLDDLDYNYLARVGNNPKPAFELRWDLYSNACALASTPVNAEELIGNKWVLYSGLTARADEFRTNLASYKGPLSAQAVNASTRLAANAEQRLRTEFLASYSAAVSNKLRQLEITTGGNLMQMTNARSWLVRMEADLDAAGALQQQASKIEGLRPLVARGKEAILQAIGRDLDRNQLGFPILLDSTKTMDANAVVQANKLLSQMINELANPAWGSSAAIDGLRAAVDARSRIANALLVEDKAGLTVSGMKAFFVPHLMKDGSDYNFTRTYRWFRLNFGSQEGEEKEVTGEENLIPLGEGSLNAATTLFCRDNADHSLTDRIADWPLPRLIKDHRAQSIDGKNWRVRWDFKEAVVGSRGVVLELQVNQPLPKPELWPR